MITINISFIDNRTVHCRVSLEGNILCEDVFKSDTSSINVANLSIWLYCCVKDIFNFSSHAETNILVNGSHDYPLALQPCIQKLKNFLEETRAIISKNQSLKNQTAHFNGKLFLNLGHTAYLYQLYEKSSRENPGQSFYDPCYAITKEEEGKNLPKPNIETLISRILEDKISKIFTHNFTYLYYFLDNYQLYLPAILEAIGVELVIVDFDTYNQTDAYYYLKKLFHTGKSPRFCIMPHIESYWDESLGLKNITYFPIPYTVRQDIQLTKLPEDYKIVVTTWARIDKITQYLKLILFFLEHVDDKNPFLDYQLFFHSVAHLLLYQTQLSPFEKMVHYNIFSQMYYHTNSLFKFEILDKISTPHEIVLYGDGAWDAFFPQYYRRPLTLEESMDFNKILNGEPALHLLMNSNYSYFENNPMVIRLLNKGTPYLNFASVVRTSELEGLSALEYKSMEELNQKANNIQNYTIQPSYAQAKDNLARLMNPCVDQFFEEALNLSIYRYESPGQALDPKPRQAVENHTRLSLSPEGIERNGENYFREMTNAHEILFKEKMMVYLQNNLVRIQECMLGVIKKDYIHFNLYSSKYSDRAYLQKFIQFYELLSKSKDPTLAGFAA